MYTNKSYEGMYSAKIYIRRQPPQQQKPRKYEKGYLKPQLASFCQDWKDPSSSSSIEAHHSTALASK